MFLYANTNQTRRFANGVDVAVEFATLGEYRVVTPIIPVGPTVDLWAADIEWTEPTAYRNNSIRAKRSAALEVCS